MTFLTHTRKTRNRSVFTLEKRKLIVILLKIMPFDCEDCHKSLKTRAILKQHLDIHSADKKYTCIQCDKKFRQKNQLTFHELRHQGTKPWKCSECTKEFFHKSDLTKHKRTHTGEKPYECNLCPKKFTQKISLRKHMERLHVVVEPLVETGSFNDSEIASDPINSTIVQACNESLLGRESDSSLDDIMAEINSQSDPIDPTIVQACNDLLLGRESDSSLDDIMAEINSQSEPIDSTIVQACNEILLGRESDSSLDDIMADINSQSDCLGLSTEQIDQYLNAAASGEGSSTDEKILSLSQCESMLTDDNNRKTSRLVRITPNYTDINNPSLSNIWKRS